MIRKEKSLLRNPEVFNGIIAGAVVVVTIATLDFVFSPDGIDILVEAHGLLFDVILFGIILLILDKRREKRESKEAIEKARIDLINRYTEEIDDFRRWDEKEAMYRIVGNIKRLNKLSVTNIELKDCFLTNAYIPQINLEGCSLKRANLVDANLYNSNLKGAILKYIKTDRTHFDNSDLSKADLSGAKGIGGGFQKVKFFNTQFRKVDFSEKNFNDSQFAGCYFKRARIVDSEFLATEFEDCNLEEVVFTKSHFHHSQFKNVKLRTSDFRNVYLYDSIFLDSDLSSLDLRGSSIRNLIIKKCIVSDLTIDQKSLGNIQFEETTGNPKIITESLEKNVLINSVRCIGITKHGERCKNLTRNVNRLCRTHSNKRA